VTATQESGPGLREANVGLYSTQLALPLHVSYAGMLCEVDMYVSLYVCMDLRQSCNPACHMYMDTPIHALSTCRWRARNILGLGYWMERRRRGESFMEGRGKGGEGGEEKKKSQ
jgi:hypothetical protein